MCPCFHVHVQIIFSILHMTKKLEFRTKKLQYSKINIWFISWDQNEQFRVDLGAYDGKATDSLELWVVMLINFPHLIECVWFKSCNERSFSCVCRSSSNNCHFDTVQRHFTASIHWHLENISTSLHKNTSIVLLMFEFIISSSNSLTFTSF